jgi:GNAT superfamily N-acetyltransferase
VSSTVRLMTEADVEPAARVQAASFRDLDQREGLPATEMTDAVWERLFRRQRHFLTNDPGGSWVATEDHQIVGSALALRRESLWGLSLLVVDPAAQSTGTGRKLLNASLTYAEGARLAVILSSTDPRAMRSYATSGFALHPQMHGVGGPDRASLPALRGRVRDGSAADAAAADDVDRAVRGAPHGPDHIRMAADFTMFVVDDVDGRGYAYLRPDGEVAVLAASDDESASALLWRCLAHADETGVAATVEHLNAAQQWAISLCYRARLKVSPAGPVFWRGRTPPPSYLPSGAYL